MATTCNWPIENNQTLEFTIYDPDTKWNSVGGLYIFARRTDATHWVAEYVGETDDFSSRLSYHERWYEATQRGATHIHARAVQQAASRVAWEKALIQNLQPPLNDHHK
jgi:hypothetical protein